MAVVMHPIDASAGAPAYSAQQMRQALSVLHGFPTATRPLGARSGVRPGTPVTTVFLSGAGSTTWNVAAHTGVLDTESPVAAGPYQYAADGADTGTITAANATNPRIDVIWVTVNDTVQDGSGIRSGVIGYSAGTAAASPSAPVAGAGTPAVPVRSMILAQINVPVSGGGAPTVTWIAPYASAAGAPVLVRNQAERDAMTPYDGLTVYRQDTNAIEVYNGASWDVFKPSALRHGVAANFSMSYSTDDAASHAINNWAWQGDTDSFQAGAISSTLTPITIPAGLSGLYAVSLIASQTGTAATGRAFADFRVNGTMVPANLQTIYRNSFGVGETVTTVTAVVPLQAGQQISANLWYVNGGAAKAIAGTLTCYRVGD